MTTEILSSVTSGVVDVAGVTTKGARLMLTGEHNRRRRIGFAVD
jgi:hypothetical protein